MRKFAVVIKLSTAVLAALLSLPALAQSSSPDNPQNPFDKMPSKYSPGCISIDQASSDYTPIDLYKGLAACITQERYEQAAPLFALARVYGLFDTQRVSDVSSHQILGVLSLHLGTSLPPTKIQAFQKYLTGPFFAPDSMRSLCISLRKIGPPTYSPSYMQAHGMSAFTGDSSDLPSTFDPAIAWTKSLKYARCDTTNEG